MPKILVAAAIALNLTLGCVCYALSKQVHAHEVAFAAMNRYFAAAQEKGKLPKPDELFAGAK